MASKNKAGTALGRGIPILFKGLALCLIALVALLILLPAPPDTKPGGVTHVAKHVPRLRDTVDPLATAPPPPREVPGLTRFPDATPEVRRPQIPAPEPVPGEKVVVVPPPGAPPPPVQKPDGARPRAPDQSTQEQALPWNQNQDVARLPPVSAPQAPAESSGDLPSRSDIQGWLRSQAWEFLGGVDAQGNILYRFEVWLDAPPEILKSIKSVSYDYDAPSATPAARDSDRSQGGFRVRFGSLACAKKVTVTLTLADGRSQRAVADGCRALN